MAQDDDFSSVALAPPLSVLRLAMAPGFMHLQFRGGPRGRRKRFRRSVAQWLEHRSPNSVSAGLFCTVQSCPVLNCLAKSPD